jgi:hypothetical protein
MVINVVPIHMYLFTYKLGIVWLTYSLTLSTYLSIILSYLHKLLPSVT